MTGPKDKFDQGDLDQFAQDLDLDMDAPIGQTFAAALRDQGVDLDFDDALDDDLASEKYGEFGAEDAAKPGMGAGGAYSVETFDIGEEEGPDEFVAEPLMPQAPPAVDMAAISLAAQRVGQNDAFALDAFEDERPAAPIASEFAGDIADDFSFEADAPAAAPPVPAYTPPAFTPPAFTPPPAAPRGSAPVFHVEPDPDFAEAPPMAEAVPEAPETDEMSAGQGLGFDYAFSPSDDGGDRMLPRISIHAFCAKAQMLGLMRTVLRDRRMKNVSMDVFEGGAGAAISHYTNETTPNLIIIEAAGDARQLLSELDSLAEFCDENIKVIVIGHHNDIRLYRELMRRGVSEYLVTPIEPVQLIRAIAGMFADPEAPFLGKTLAVTGVKGGVGASSIAHNLAWALSERFKVNSTLVDLDLNFGTTGLDFNQDAQATIADALMSPDRFDDAVMSRLITKATDRLSLFTAPATLDRTYNLEPETYSRILEQVRGSVPYVVLDLPHIWSDWFKTTIIGADEIVVVAGPDLASLRNGKNLIDFLKAARPNDKPPRLVLNMVGLPKRPEIPAKDFGQAIGVEPSLVLPFEPQVFGTAANNGQMIFDVAADSKCAQGLDQLAAQLSGREIQTEKPSILKKLLKTK